MKRLIGLLMGVFSLTACATGTTNLTLGLADDAVKPGVISEAPARTLYLAEVTDERDPTRIDRIGNKRNGYGMVMGAVGTNEPVTDTVADTLTKTLRPVGTKWFRSRMRAAAGRRRRENLLVRLQDRLCDGRVFR